MASHHASPPSPTTVQQALSPKSRPHLELEPAPKVRKSTAPISPIPSDSEDERQLAGSSNSPPAQLASISEAEDDSDEDEETENARTQGMQGVQTEAAIKSGYLMKKGERRKAWKKRWFVLRSKRIYYYKDDKEYKLLRDISLNDVSTVAEVQVKKHENVFGLVTPKRTYYVEARTHADMQEWVTQIERARDDFRRNKAEETTVATVEGEGADTPTTRGETSTPTQTAHTQPISIVGPSSPPVGGLSSSVATSSTSPEGRSSSFTSQSSVTSPLAPPNSFVQGPAVPMNSGAADLNSVDARLAGRQREHSATSSVGGEPVRHSTRPASPGVASSSEDEDDDYFGSANPAHMMHVVGSPPLQVSSLDPTRVIMRGYLTKQGKRKTWRKRYFLLISTRLMYARSHMDQKIHRQIPLARILDVVDVDAPAPHMRTRAESQPHEGLSSPHLGSGIGGEKRYENSFKIITAKRTYTVCAPDEESAIKWISAIKVLLAAQRTQSPPQDATQHYKTGSPSNEPVNLPPPVAASPVPAPSTPNPQQRERTASAGAAAIDGMPSIEAKLVQAGAVHPGHTRNRSATDAAKLAVFEAGERFSARA